MPAPLIRVRSLFSVVSRGDAENAEESQMVLPASHDPDKQDNSAETATGVPRRPQGPGERCHASRLSYWPHLSHLSYVSHRPQ